MQAIPKGKKRAGHDCTGEDCPICACMQQCENTLHTMAYGGVLAVVAAIEKALTSVDSTNEKVYQENADAYVEKLNDLDRQYEETVNGASRKDLLFGNRFPFRYLAEDSYLGIMEENLAVLKKALQ